MSVLIVGCGYLGERAASRWHAAGSQVYALTRSPERAGQFVARGWSSLMGDLLRPETLPAFPLVEAVLFAIGYDRTSGASISQVYVRGMQNVLARLPDQTGKVIYISSTGVYGQTDGAWIDETSPCHPVREGGRACLEAEELLAAHSLGQRRIVLRLAGIYGPGRIPRRADLLAGRPIAAPAEGFLNLIHVDDAAEIVVQAARAAAPPCLYTVADGQPPQRREYYAELARLLGAPPPNFRPADADSPAAERAGSDKRVEGGRVLRDLGLTLRYPSYREGLAAILAEEAAEGAA